MRIFVTLLLCSSFTLFMPSLKVKLALRLIDCVSLGKNEIYMEECYEFETIIKEMNKNTPYIKFFNRFLKSFSRYSEINIEKLIKHIFVAYIQTFKLSENFEFSEDHFIKFVHKLLSSSYDTDASEAIAILKDECHWNSFIQYLKKIEHIEGLNIKQDLHISFIVAVQALTMSKTEDEIEIAIKALHIFFADNINLHQLIKSHKGHLLKRSIKTYEEIILQFICFDEDTHKRALLKHNFCKQIENLIAKKNIIYSLECCICQEEIANAKWVVANSCHHMFHKNCLKTALQFRHCCPLCREPIIQ